MTKFNKILNQQNIFHLRHQTIKNKTKITSSSDMLHLLLFTATLLVMLPLFNVASADQNSHVKRQLECPCADGGAAKYDCCGEWQRQHNHVKRQLECPCADGGAAKYDCCGEWQRKHN